MLVAGTVGVGSAVLVFGENITVGEVTLVACGAIVDVKSNARLEVSGEVALTDSDVVNVTTEKISNNFA